jgi:general stress protein 26
MDKHNLINKLVEILDQVNVGLLATSDKEGKPSIRWMVPAVINGRPNAIFALTTPKLGKYIAEECNPQVMWMIQTANLDTVVSLHGKMNVIDNPSLKMEVLSVVGKKIHNFWKLDREDKEMVVLETVLENGSYYVPMKGKQEKVSFTE